MQTTISKQIFLDYINKYGKDSQIMLFGNNLSFAGSDGPTLKDWGFKDGDKYYYSNLSEIDRYIQEGCRYHYGGELPIPEKTFSDYVKQISNGL